MPLIVEVANAENTSGPHNEFPKWGRRPKATPHFGRGGRRPPLIMWSAGIFSIGHFYY